MSESKLSATSGYSNNVRNYNFNFFAGLPSGCDRALIEPNQILTIATQANIAEISFGGDSTIVFDSFSEAAFGQVRYNYSLPLNH